MFDEVINVCCINIVVSNIKMSMYKNQCMINSVMQISFEDNTGICQLTDVLKNMLTHAHTCFIQMHFSLLQFFLFLFYG